VASFPLLRRADSSRASADASRNARVLAGAIPRGIPSQAAAPGGVRHREPTVMPAAGGTDACVGLRKCSGDPARYYCIYDPGRRGNFNSKIAFSR
jgi:hypothetical protein